MADSTSGKKFKLWHILIGMFAFFILTIGGCVGSVFLSTQGAVTETNEFFEILSDDTVNPGEAYSETSVLFQEATSQQDFATFLRNFPIFSDVKDMKFSSRAIQTTDLGSLATLQGTIYANDGSTSPVEVSLLKEDGEWKIMYFSTEYTEDTEDYEEL